MSKNQQNYIAKQIFNLLTEIFIPLETLSSTTNIDHHSIITQVFTALCFASKTSL